MKGSDFTRYALGICAVSLAFTGCGGSQSQVGPPTTMEQNAAKGENPARARRGGATTAFTVSGRTILVDGKAFYVNGVDYGPTQIDDYPDPNPLDDSNAEIWTPDLTKMRADGVNAVKVYNVGLPDIAKYIPPLGNDHKLKAGETGKVGRFLDAAWNNGDHPVYVVLCFFFGGADVLDKAKLDALKSVYKEVAKTYGGYPALMGISLGAEINSEAFINNPAWWTALNEISDSITDGYKASNAQKLITTTMVDDGTPKGLLTMLAGEKNGFKIDVWGIDSYRGHTFTDIWTQIKNGTTKPEVMAEYGATAAYYPASAATYDQAQFHCVGYTGKKLSVDDARELPPNGNPRMEFLVNYVSDNANELFANRASNGGVGSGGFYFEWNDEWWKSGWPKGHIGGYEGNVIIQKDTFPGCYDDAAWYGLNAVAPGSPNARIPRPTLDAIKAIWAK